MGRTSYATLSPPSNNVVTSVISATGMKGWFIDYAKRRTLAVLESGIRKGSLKIVDSSGSVICLGEPADSAKKVASLHVHDDRFWIRVYLRYDVGFSEAYMAQEIDTPDMKAVLNLYIDNLSTLSGLSSIAYKAWYGLEAFLLRFLHHGLSDSVLNVAGYDISNSMYQCFLSKELQYSCPIWTELEGGVRGDLENARSPGDLESAQATKIKYVLEKARLRPGDRLLEIGSGWGSVAIAAALMGCQVDTLTLSVEQKELAEERIRQAGVQDKVTVHFMDYRAMPRWFEKQFDAVISLEMLEGRAVGVAYMDTYVKAIDWALKSDRASVVLTSTTYPDSTYTSYQGNDFVRMYHWPHTVPPSPLSLLSDFGRAARGKFTIDSVQDFGPHYPRCLREWGRRFEENWDDELIRLQSQYPALRDEKTLEMFHRRWKYMFVYMEVAYSRQWLSLHCWCLARPGQVAVPCA